MMFLAVYFTFVRCAGLSTSFMLLSVPQGLNILLIFLESIAPQVREIVWPFEYQFQGISLGIQSLLSQELFVFRKAISKGLF